MYPSTRPARSRTYSRKLRLPRRVLLQGFEIIRPVLLQIEAVEEPGHSPADRRRVRCAEGQDAMAHELVTDRARKIATRARVRVAQDIHEEPAPIGKAAQFDNCARRLHPLIEQALSDRDGADFRRRAVAQAAAEGR